MWKEGHGRGWCRYNVWVNLRWGRRMSVAESRHGGDAFAGVWRRLLLSREAVSCSTESDSRVLVSNHGVEGEVRHC